MKSLIKKVFIFLLFIALLILIPKISAANAQSCPGTNPCTRTITGYSLSTMCVNLQTKVNVTNLPAGKNIYLACDGDYGEGYVRNKTMQNGVCVGTYCSGGWGGCAGQNWCEGDIMTAITGSSSEPVTTSTPSVIPLIHCSCKNALPVSGQPLSPNLGCLQVSVSSTAPTMNNACNNYNPTVTNVITPESLGCTVSGGVCGQNGTVQYPTINITCPKPTCSVTFANIPTLTPNTSYTVPITLTSANPTWQHVSVYKDGSTTRESGLTSASSLTFNSGDPGTTHTLKYYNLDYSGYPVSSGGTGIGPDANAPLCGSISYTVAQPACVPITSCGAAQVCGSISDGCGGTVNCGTCTSPSICNENTHTCVCTPKTSCDNGQVCGSIPDGCGGQITCNPGCDATTGQTCNNNACSCPTGQSPTHLACGTDHTCQVVNTCGTDSCTAGQNCGPATTLSFVIGLDGIGTTGDQKNSAYLPVAGQPLSGSTLSPVHTTRPVTVFLTDSSQQTQQFQGNVVYDATTTDQNYGKFATTTPIDLGVHIQPGTYTVYVTVGAHLTKSLGTVTITLGQNNPVANGQNAGNLVAGDITGVSSNTADNKLTIEDYNVLISCSIFSKDSTLCNSDSHFLTLSDLDDNGNSTGVRAPLVNQFDYNLWLREYSKTPNGDTPPNITTSASAQTQASPALTIVSVVETSTSSAATTIQQPATGTQTGTSSSPAAATTIQQPATDTQTGTTNATASGQ